MAWPGTGFARAYHPNPGGSGPMAPCNRIRKGYLRPIRPIDGHPPLLNIVNPPLLGLALGAWERQPAVKYHGRMRGLLCSKPCAPGSSHSYSEGDDTMLFSDPFEALFNLQQALDTFRQSDWLERSTSGTGPFPPVNAFRKGDDFVIIGGSAGGQKIRPRYPGQRPSHPHCGQQVCQLWGQGQLASAGTIAWAIRSHLHAPD
jgi:hypothetical protein